MPDPAHIQTDNPRRNCKTLLCTRCGAKDSISESDATRYWPRRRGMGFPFNVWSRAHTEFVEAHKDCLDGQDRKQE